MGGQMGHKHGYSNHPLYKVWVYMKSRCYNENDTGYQNYGGRGIYMTQDWIDNPSAFVEWGVLNNWEKGLYLDRIDNDSGYKPSNCRFVTVTESNINQRVRKDNTSGFRGVGFHKGKQAWIARVSVNGKRKEFHRQTAELASKARDEYIVENGLSHPLNGGA